MQEHYDLIAVLPVGPGTRIEFIEDTIKSILFYCQCKVKIILPDDSSQGLGALIKEKYPETDLLVNKKSMGLNGGLYITLGLAYSHAVRQYRFKTLLKIDTDALVIGPDPQADAEHYFQQNPHIGIAGLYKSGLETRDEHDNVLPNRWPRNYMFDITCTWKIIKRPVANFTMRKYFMQAFANGYDTGENIFGGSCFLSEAMLISLKKAHLLPVYGLKNTRMEEDHLWGMFAKVVGFGMGDLASGELLFGMGWKHLPASPEVLVRRKKKIIHSTRAWGTMNETDIRRFFRELRVSESVLEGKES